MAKYCISCGKEINDEDAFCSGCGARQNVQYQNVDPYQQYNSSHNRKMSTNKILSLVALGLALVGVVFGGLFTEIAALVFSIIVLNSREECEKEAKTFAKIALVISIILMVIMLIYIVMMGGFIFNQLDKLDVLEDQIMNDLNTY